MQRLSLIALALLAFLHVAYGQNAVRFDPANVTQVGQTPPSGMPPLLAVPNASIVLCGYPANASPCTNFAASYTDATAAVACSPAQPVVLNGTATCTSVADAGGSFGFWVKPGNYSYMVTTQQGQTYGPYYFSASTASGSGFCTGTGSCTLAGSLAAGIINGVAYPAICQAATNKPSWCAGSTADAYIRAACSQLPTTGGFVDLVGLTGVIASQVTCSTPTKQVIIKTDPTSPLRITEQDGLITFPLYNHSSMIGPGAGQCQAAFASPHGIYLDPSAHVEAIVGNGTQDGTQEDMAIMGNCFWGYTGANANAIAEAVEIYTNTTIANNNFSVCNSRCLWIHNAGSITIYGNEFNLTSGAYGVYGVPVEIDAKNVNGCGAGPVNIWGADAEHANGGTSDPDLYVHGDGNGALVCGAYIHEMYIERNVSGTPDVAGISLSDCWGCTVTNVSFGGGLGTAANGDALRIAQTKLGRTLSVVVSNIQNVFGSYQNTINDTTTTGSVLTYALNPIVSTYISNPGYQQPPVLPQNTLQALTSPDSMNGAGSLATGNSTYGTGFSSYGCQPTAGVTCTYTRTNSTAPPGFSYSQKVQIVTNTDPSGGDNGIEYTTEVPFTAGVPYQVTFWMKGDGSFTGLPLFILGDPTVPSQYCSYEAGQPLTTTWQLFSVICTPTSSGTSYLAWSTVATPVGATGSYWVGGMSFAQVSPLTPGGILTAVGPYGIGNATTTQTTTTVNSVSCLLGSSCTIPITTTGFSGTKTAGSCVLTIANGLITAVSGC